MKTMPKVGDRVWFWDTYSKRQHATVTAVDFDGFKDAVQMKRDDGYNYVCHYSQINGRIVKKPRKCEECAKPKQLFYVGHNNESLGKSSLGEIKGDRTRASIKWPYISTLALISTEEVKK